jgi:hypothetical protein
MTSQNTIKKIHAAIDKLFERLKDRVLGIHIHDKSIAITTTRPDLTLAGLATAAAAVDGARLSKPTLAATLHVASSYLDSAKERAKALIVNEVVTARDPEATLGGQLSEVWSKVTSDVERIVDSEAQRHKAIGTLEGISMINLQAGIEDPSVFFVIVRDQHVCSECKRLHMSDDGVTPRMYKLSEVGAGYHKKGDPNPKVAGLHPHCRCGMATMLPGYGFDGGGKVRFVAVGHDEFAQQRGLAKTEVMAKADPANVVIPPVPTAQVKDPLAQQIRSTLTQVHRVRQHHLQAEDAGLEPEVHPLVPIHPDEFSRCTSTACHIAQKHGGKVIGYKSDNDIANGVKPKDRIGDLGGAHDFAMIGGRYLADYWSRDYDAVSDLATPAGSHPAPDLYDMTNPKHREAVRLRYGDPANWMTLYDYSNPDEENPWHPE